MIYNTEQAPRYNDKNMVPKIPGVPVIPPLPSPDQAKYSMQCGKCGILIPNGPWMYSCANHDCPIQVKATC